jgi:hypothetical protein
MGSGQAWVNADLGEMRNVRECDEVWELWSRERDRALLDLLQDVGVA